MRSRPPYSAARASADGDRFNRTAVMALHSKYSASSESADESHRAGQESSLPKWEGRATHDCSCEVAMWRRNRRPSSQPWAHHRFTRTKTGLTIPNNQIEEDQERNVLDMGYETAASDRAASHVAPPASSFLYLISARG